MKSELFNKFSLNNQVAIITGGAGLFGVKHAEVVVEAGGVPVLWDINENTEKIAKDLSRELNFKVLGMQVDITSLGSIKKALKLVLDEFQRVDILVNNAAKDPKITKNDTLSLGRFESFQQEIWEEDLAVGLTGAFLCSQVIGVELAKRGKGVILNIASDLGVIAPDQRIYQKENLPVCEQPAKPVTYSVIKHGLIGLTKYLATYWADKNIRVNAISPGGVYNNQPDDFVKKLSSLIPMGRMAEEDEYKAAVLFLLSEASSYMTGSNLIIDGGRTCW